MLDRRVWGWGDGGPGVGPITPRLTSRSRHTTHSEVCTSSSSAGGAEGLTASGSSSGAVGRTPPSGGFSSSVGKDRG